MHLESASRECISRAWVHGICIMIQESHWPGLYRIRAQRLLLEAQLRNVPRVLPNQGSQYGLGGPQTGIDMRLGSDTSEVSHQLLRC